jgi:uncharacterized protein YyaL (SSP411 family)
MAKNLYSLGTVYDDSVYTNMGKEMYHTVSARVQQQPRFHIQWCSMAALFSARNYEIVIMGKDALVRNKEMQRHYLPTSILMGSKQEETLPLLRYKYINNKTLIYVCTDRLCKKPEEETNKALQQMINR